MNEAELTSAIETERASTAYVELTDAMDELTNQIEKGSRKLRKASLDNRQELVGVLQSQLSELGSNREALREKRDARVNELKAKRSALRAEARAKLSEPEPELEKLSDEGVIRAIEESTAAETSWRMRRRSLLRIQERRRLVAERDVKRKELAAIDQKIGPDPVSTKASFKST